MQFSFSFIDLQCQKSAANHGLPISFFLTEINHFQFIVFSFVLCYDIKAKAREKRDHAAQGKESRDKQSWETRHQSGLEIFRNDRDDEYCRNQDKDKRKHAEKAYRSVVFVKRKNGFQHFASISECP